MIEALQSSINGFLQTLMSYASGAILIWVMGFVFCMAVRPLRNVGTQLFVTLPMRGLGHLLRAGIVVGGMGLKRGAHEVVDFRARLGRVPDPEAPLVQFTERRPMDPPPGYGPGFAEGETKALIKHGDWYAFAKTYKEAVHMVMMAAPGAGKDQAGVLPLLLAQLLYGEEHLVIVDPKRELRQSLYPYLRSDDRVFVYSFSRETGVSSSLAVALDEEDVADAAAFLMPKGHGDSAHFDLTARRLFVQVEAALKLDLGRRPRVAEIFEFIEDPDLFDSLCERHPRIPRVTQNEKEFGSVKSTTETHLEELRWPRVRRVFNAGGDVEQPFERGGRSIVFVEPDVLAGERLEKYVGLVVHHLYNLAAADGNPRGTGSKRGTKFVVDEAASYMRLQKIPSYLDIGRGNMVQLCYVLQNWPQLEDVLDEKKAKRCWGSTELRVVGAGTDYETADLISKLTPMERVTFLRPRQPGEFQRRRDQKVRPLLSPHHITGLRKDDRVSEWAVTLGPDAELIRIDKQTQYFYARTPEPDLAWEYMIPCGVPENDEEEYRPPEEPDDKGPDDEGPEDPPGEPVEEPRRRPHGDESTQTRPYRRPPKRPPQRKPPRRSAGAPPSDISSGPPEDLEPPPDVLEPTLGVCRHCGGEAPAGRAVCAKCPE